MPAVARSPRHLVRTPEQALALLRTRGVLIQSGTHPRVASLEEATGGAVGSGSIATIPSAAPHVALLASLIASGEAISVKLCGGQPTLVHRALWPALYRVVTDPTWRARAAVALTPASCRLLEQVEHRGEARLLELSARAPSCGSGDRRATLGAKEELEARLLVQVGQIATARGGHETVLRSWTRWAPPEVAAAAAALTLAAAERTLRRACGERPPRR
jgi:hypothetical protein